jgi:two-component system, cell cycle sensor histidine kinase and response regulator CckA
MSRNDTAEHVGFFMSWSWKDFLLIVGIAFSYFLAHLLAFFFPDSEQVIMAVWPAGGIGFCALLLNPYRRWPALVFAFYVAGVSADVFFTNRSFFEGIGYMTGNMIESLGCVWLVIKWSRKTAKFDHVNEVLALICGVIFVNSLSTCIGAGTAVLGRGVSFAHAWRSWYISDGLGVLILGPFLVIWFRIREFLPRISTKWLAETVVFITLWCVMISNCFQSNSTSDLVFLRPYMLTALLIWPALRLGQLTLSASLVILAAMTILSNGAIAGPSPFGGKQIDDRLLLIQIFLGFTAFTGYLIAAIYSESRSAEHASREDQARLRALGDNLPDGMVYQVVREHDGRIKIQYVSAGLKQLIGVAPEEAMKDASILYDKIVEEDRAIVVQAQELSAKNMSALNAIARFRVPDGRIHWIQISSSPRLLPDRRVLWDGIAMEVTERKLAEEALKNLATSFAHLSGKSFFEAVSFHIATALAMDYVFVGKIDATAGSVMVLGGYALGEPMSTLAYALADTPCGALIGKEFVIYPSAVQDQFPKDLLLIQTGVEGYFGVSIFNKQLQLIGIMAALHTQPLADPQTIRQLFNTYVDRVAAEMQRGEAQEALQRSEARFRKLFDGAADAAFVHNEEGRILDVNQVACDSLDYSREELLQMSISDIEISLHPSVLDTYWERILVEPAATVEGEHLRRDGSTFPVEIHISPFESGESTLFFAAVRNITERKRIERDLQESNELLSLFMRYSPIYAFIKSVTATESRVLQASDNFQHLIGISSEAMTGKTMEELFPAEFAAKISADDWSVVSKGVSSIIHEDFNGRNYTTIKYPIVRADKTLLAGYTIDITDQKRAEEELVRIFDTTPILICTARPDGYFEKINKEWTKILGFSREELLKIGWAALIHPDDIEKTRAETARGLTGMDPMSFINRYRSKDGSYRILEWNATATADGLIYACAKDITDQNRLEEQFRQAQKMEAIGQLAGGIAHDFNNILASMMMRLSLLKYNSNLEVDVLSMMKELEEEAQRAASLTQQLLMFSRRSVMEIRLVDINEIIANLLNMLGRLLGEHILLVSEQRSHLPLVEGDVGKLEQVLLNLAVNARDAMPNGGRIIITTEVVEIHADSLGVNPSRHPGRFVCFSVADTGCGMDAITLDRIFEPFFTTKDVGKGTGLGLATVNGIVAQHRGWVEVESQVGQGTTFRVYLPASEKVYEEEKSLSQDIVSRGHETLLIVEDEEKVRNVLVKSLRVLGYRVFEAANGQAAMSLWQHYGSEIDLLLTDMVMPEGMTGIELVERVRAEKPGLKVILSSGYSAEITEFGKEIAAGIVYLPKPYQISMLSQTIRDCLDGK